MAREIQLLAMPTSLYLDFVSHLDSILRELRLVADSIEKGHVKRVSIEMAHGIEDLFALFSNTLNDAAQQVQLAVDEGRPEVSLTIAAGRDAPVNALRFIELLDQADDWARSGVLLTEPASAAAVQLRRWIAQEVVMQSDGAPPWPFSSRPTGRA